MNLAPPDVFQLRFSLAIQPSGSVRQHPDGLHPADRRRLGLPKQARVTPPRKEMLSTHPAVQGSCGFCSRYPRLSQCQASSFEHIDVQLASFLVPSTNSAQFSFHLLTRAPAVISIPLFRLLKSAAWARNSTALYCISPLSGRSGHTFYLPRPLLFLFSVDIFLKVVFSTR